ncbi:glycoside hydrolase family 31 protein [Saccharata proteae CBS 121410]|uniref:Glycoside hydrolase family 31 protein n=1 Tax=Saccharata proteae CBS 121410 TaxID=1314787 RepID=A0A6A5YD60_9PEZI|nr:glycoside hydrolase family 31 protein [Saccharata proteae CBS 121410]
MRLLSLLALGRTAGASGLAARQAALSNESCPGYIASNVVDDGSSFTADLKLAGPACNVYGQDLDNLKLNVEYQTENRLHVQIYDASLNVYQVPESVLPRPHSNSSVQATESAIQFKIVENPFSFAVVRSETNETLFDTSGAPLIFESQYLRLRTKLADSPHLYGLGEHTDPFQLNTSNYTRTLWSRDAYTIPAGTNLYGNHPVYFDHRGSSGTHGVFLLSSSGMDIKINNTAADGQHLEYNTLGGIVDLYFMAGPTPKEVASQYAEVVGLPAMQSYWTLGFHNCRYGYRDVYAVAEAVANYSLAGIPLETMWTDIDYMDLRKVFTLDPDRFPISKMREMIDHLHAHQQHYVVMIDPAVAYLNNSAYSDGADMDVFLKQSNGSYYNGVVWPGVTVFPDWFHPNATTFWTNQFGSFFDADSGLDIDALWIDMNEASNFCTWPCADPYAFADANDDPPAPPAVRKNSGRYIPGFPNDFQPAGLSQRRKRQDSSGSMLGLPGRDLISPAYEIHNAAGSLSNLTIFSNVIHYNGVAEYDTHNIYGTMMSSTSREAMLARRPGRRPLVITRSTFAGAGAHVGHWLGDNYSDWDHYRISIAELMEFAALFQIPMVGSDVCGFAGNTTETLCARWAMLGAFSPFYRDHNSNDAIAQEFYQWPLVTEAAKIAIDARYRMLDYLYTALYRQNQTGNPLINPMFFIYPEDENTFPIDLQYFFGDSILVSPVTEENATSVDIYLPEDVFYDFWTGERVVGNASYIHLDDVGFTSIPLHVRGGSIVPLRAASANTTTELRKQNFTLMIAPGLDGKASGSLYLDEGDAIEQPETSLIEMDFNGTHLSTSGSFGYDPGVSIEGIVLLGANNSAVANTAAIKTPAGSSAASGSVAASVSLTGPDVAQLR